MGYRVAVVGATGNVGREMLNILEELNFPVDEIHAIASRKSIGVEVGFGEQGHQVRGHRAVRLLQGRHRADERLRRLLQGMVAEDRPRPARS